MKRLTQKENNSFKVDKEMIEINGISATGDAVDKLGRFEDMLETLINRQHEIEKNLDVLREQDKAKTVKFREALADKFTNLRLISLMQTYKLIDSDEFK